MEVVTSKSFLGNDTFPASFLNMLVDYPLGEKRIGNKSWTNWNKAPLR